MVKRRASILMLALWSLCLLSTFVLVLGYGIRQKLNALSHIENNDKLHYVVEAAVKRAVAVLKIPQEPAGVYALKQQWSNSPKDFKEIKLGDANFSVVYEHIDIRTNGKKSRYGLVDEERKFNINTQPKEALSRLFVKAAKLDQQQADDLSASIIDWRDANNTEEPGGAEGFYYNSLNFPYAAKNKAFEVLEELYLVKGVEYKIFEAILPFITIYGSGQVNINTVDCNVLSALGMDEDFAKKILSFRAGDDGIDATSDDHVFTKIEEIIPELSQNYSLTINEISQISNLVASGAFTIISDNFMIKAKAHLNRVEQTTEICCVFQNSSGRIAYYKETQKAGG